MNDLFDTLRQNSDKTEPVTIDERRITSVTYADDILLLSETQEGLIEQIKIIHKFCTENGLTINYDFDN